MEPLFEKLKSNAIAKRQRIVLPESTEPRTLTAAARIIADGIADIKASQILPEAETAYMLQLTTSDGTYALSTAAGITIAEKPAAIYFVAQEDGTYALSNGEEFIVYEGSNNWTLSTSSEAYGWTIAISGEGYSITGKNGLLGTNK